MPKYFIKKKGTLMVSHAGLQRWLALFIMLILVILPAHGYACPVCYGAADSPMTEGMNMGIITLLGIIGTVLAMFIAFFIYLRNRANRYSVNSI